MENDENASQEVLVLRGKLAFLESMAFETFKRLPRARQVEVAVAVEHSAQQLPAWAGQVEVERLMQRLRAHLTLRI